MGTLPTTRLGNILETILTTIPNTIATTILGTIRLLLYGPYDHTCIPQPNRGTIASWTALNDNGDQIRPVLVTSGES